MARAAGHPVYKFPGGYRDSVPVYITGGYYPEGKGIPELISGGFSGGYSVEDDDNRVTPLHATHSGRNSYDLDITWPEEPLHWYDDAEPLKQLKLNTRIPLASGVS